MAASPNRWAGQAAQDAMLKFAPQQTSLAEALQQAKEAYGQTVTAGNQTATLSARAAKNAIPQIQQIYGKATSAQNAGATLVNAQLAGLPGVANQYKADQASEVGQQLANLLGSKSRDEAMLTNDQVAAREGAQFSQTNARATLQKTLQGLLSRSTATAQEQGAFASTEAEKLAHEAEKLEQAETASKRSAATSENNSIRSTAGAERRSERSAAGKGAPGGFKPLSPDKQVAASSMLRAIEHEARALRQEGAPRGQIYSELTSEGGGKNVVKKDENGRAIKNSKGEPQYEKTPVLKAHDVLLSEAALDSVFGYGRVSKGTMTKLHAAGYSLKALGLEGPAPARASKPLPIPNIGSRRNG